MSDDDPLPPIPGLVIRPPGPFLDLPLRWRWEATRRHPYYLHFWAAARRFFAGPQEVPPAERTFTELAFAVLQTLGVSAAPVDPAAPFEDLLGPDADPAFLSGSCLPVRLRDLASELIQQLSPAELAYLGHLCRVAVHPTYSVEGDDAHRSQQRLRTLLRLDGVSSPVLDGYGARPLFRIHPGAAEKTVLSDVTEQLRRFRRRFGLPDRRVHTKKFPGYFAAWDLREGWTGSGYDRTAERSFDALASELNISRATAASRYKSAFELITGHRFQPSRWARVFLWPRIHPSFVPPDAGAAATVRQTGVRVPQTVLESALGGHARSIMEQPAVAAAGGRDVGDDVACSQLVAELDELIDRGLDDARIAASMTDAFGRAVAPAEVAYYRSRRAEFRRL